MSVADNYAPQSENLEQLTRVLTELAEITQQNTVLKSSIVDKIDSVVRHVKHGDESNYTDLITTSEQFLSVFEEKDPNKYGNVVKKNNENNKKTENSSTADQKQQLLNQNQRLKEVLKNRRKYLQEVQAVNGSYEDAIDEILYKIEDTKSQSEKKKLEVLRKLRETIENSEREEFELFEEVVNKQELVQRLASIVRDFHKKLYSE